MPDVAGYVFQKWPQQYFWPTFFSRVLPIPIYRQSLFPFPENLDRTLECLEEQRATAVTPVTSKWHIPPPPHHWPLEPHHHSVKRPNLAHMERPHGKHRCRRTEAWLTANISHHSVGEQALNDSGIQPSSPQPGPQTSCPGQTPPLTASSPSSWHTGSVVKINHCLMMLSLGASYYTSLITRELCF